MKCNTFSQIVVLVCFHPLMYFYTPMSLGSVFHPSGNQYRLSWRSAALVRNTSPCARTCVTHAVNQTILDSEKMTAKQQSIVFISKYSALTPLELNSKTLKKIIKHPIRSYFLFRHLVDPQICEK